MSPRRWLLLAIAILGLALLVVGGVVLAFSTPVTDQMAQQERLPNGTSAQVGLRAVVVPSSDPAALGTLAANGTDLVDHRPGTILLVADGSGSVPASSTNVSIVRALAYLAPNANGSYEPARLHFANLTRVSGDTTALYEADVDVAPLALGKAGFLVKADTEETIHFVPTERVVGELYGYEPGGSMYTLLAIGAIAFVAPIAALIMTHKPSGTRGLPAGTNMAGACPECRAPLVAGSEFCTRCGAWLKR